MKQILAGLDPQPIANRKSKIANPNSLTNTLGFWELTLNGRRAILQQNQGLFYVAWLLAHPFAPPINALGLVTKVFERFGAHQDFSQAMPWLACHQDDPLVGQVLRKKQTALETILDSPAELEAVKTEALRDLCVIYDLQQTHVTQLAATATATAKTISSQASVHQSGRYGGQECRRGGSSFTTNFKSKVAIGDSNDLNGHTPQACERLILRYGTLEKRAEVKKLVDSKSSEL